MTEGAAIREVPFAPLVWLFLVAAVLGFLSVLLPHDPITRDAVVVAISASGLLIAVVLMAFRRRGVGHGGVVVLLLIATALTAAAIWATGGPPNATSALYMWICLYGAYALPERWALGIAVACASSYVFVTILAPPEFPPVAHLVTSIASLFVVTLIVSTLQSRLHLLVGKLEFAARTDPLTGLANRRHFNEELEHELERSRRTGRPLTVIVCDLDHFKNVNDTFGHIVGDAVLRLVGRVLMDQSRATDLPARFGGEEFAVILPDTDLEAGEQVADRLRTELERRSLAVGPPVTLSLGVACTAQVGRSSEALYRAADRALYVAKEDGRNRRISAGPVRLAVVA